MLSAWALVTSYARAQTNTAPLSPANPTRAGGYFPFSLSAKGAGFLGSSVIYQLDDGTAEDTIGYGDGSENAEALWFNQFDIVAPSCQSPIITSVSIAWGSPSHPDDSNGTPVTIAIWSDPNGDRNPSDAVLLASVTGTIQNANTNTFVTYAFPAPVTLPPGAVSFFVGDMTPANNGPQLNPQALDESSPLHRQSWIALMSSYGPVNLTNPGANDTVGIIDDFGFAANWMIRATAILTPPTPTPTPPPRKPLWYNGAFDGVNGLSNEQNTSLGAGQYAHTYDNFNVTDPGGWAVTSVFSDNLTDLAETCITGATWEIRQGITPGDGGKLIASGMTTTPQVFCGSQITFGYPECSVTVAGLFVYLAPGNGYYLNVTPIGSGLGRSFIATTSGAGAVGSPPGNDENAYFDSNFFGASFVPTGDPSIQQPYDYSMGLYGIIINADPPMLLRAFSRKTQVAGTSAFDLELPLTGPEGIESRGLGQDTIHLTFNNYLVSVGSVTSSCGKASVIIDPYISEDLIVTVGSPECNAKNITITVDGVTDIRGLTTSATVTYGKLLGDVDASGVVDVLDGQAIRAVAPAPVDSVNFRDDLNIDGKVNTKDHMIAKAHRGERLPKEAPIDGSSIYIEQRK